MPVIEGRFSVGWHDRGREPQCPANPAFPSGIDVDGRTSDQADGCRTTVPYPAPRCGGHLIECLICGTRIYLIAAGRSDDPRSVVVPCRSLLRA